MIHHKKETTSNPKNPRRKPLVDRWKFKDFVEKKKWMEDGLNVSTSLFKNILILTPYIFIFKPWNNIWVILNLNILSVWMFDGQVWPEEDQDPVFIGCPKHKNIIFGDLFWFLYCCFRDCTLVARWSSQSLKTAVTLNHLPSL